MWKQPDLRMPLQDVHGKHFWVCFHRIVVLMSVSVLFGVSDATFLIPKKYGSQICFVEVENVRENKQIEQTESNKESLHVLKLHSGLGQLWQGKPSWKGNNPEQMVKKNSKGPWCRAGKQKIALAHERSWAWSFAKWHNHQHTVFENLLEKGCRFGFGLKTNAWGSDDITPGPWFTWFTVTSTYEIDGCYWWLMILNDGYWKMFVLTTIACVDDAPWSLNTWRGLNHHRTSNCWNEFRAETKHTCSKQCTWTHGYGRPYLHPVAQNGHLHRWIFNCFKEIVKHQKQLGTTV